MPRFASALGGLLASLLFAPAAIANMEMVNVATTSGSVGVSAQTSPPASGARRALNAAQAGNTIDRFDQPLLPQYNRACLKKPDRGPCKGLFEAYYFDTSSRSCKVFIWGGCQGEVPFRSQQDCERTCFTPLPE